MRLAIAVLVLVVTVGAARAVPLEVLHTLCVAQSARTLTALPTATRDAALQALADAGWTTLRVDFAWSLIEPQRGQLDFTAYDALVDAARAHGLRVVGVLTGGTAWAAPAGATDPENTPPADPADYARFAAAVAKHWKKPPAGQTQAIAGWELWDEPNAPTHWQPAPDAVAYAKLASAAVRAIRKVDKRVAVSTGGLASFDDVATYGANWAFLGTVGRVKAFRAHRAKFTAASFHPSSWFFVTGAAPESSANPLRRSLVGQIEDFVTRESAAKIFLRPWITALGWHTAPMPDGGLPPGVTEAQQAQYLVRATTLALSQGIERICWATLVDGTDPVHVAADAFGLLRRDGDALQPKPAWTAAQTFATQLAGTIFLQDLRDSLGLEAGAFALCFRSSAGKRTSVVFWSTGDTVPVVFSDIPDDTKTVTLTPIDGGPAQTYPEGTRSVVVQLNPSPVILRIQE